MKNPKCLNFNTAVFVCTDSRCNRQNPFICNGCQNNKCQNIHKKCSMKKWSNLTEEWTQLRNNKNTEFNKLAEIVEETLIKSIQYLESQMKHFLQWKQKYSMPQKVIQLYQSFESDTQYKWNGTMICKLMNNIEIDSKSIIRFNEKQIKNQSSSIIIKSQQLQKRIRNLYQSDNDESKTLVYSIEQVQVVSLKEKSSLKLSQPPPYVNTKSEVIKSLPDTTIFKIKQAYIHNLNARLLNLHDSPQNLELKCNQQYYLVVYHYSDIRKQLKAYFSCILLFAMKWVYELLFSVPNKLFQRQQKLQIRMYHILIIKGIINIMKPYIIYDEGYIIFNLDVYKHIRNRVLIQFYAQEFVFLLLQLQNFSKALRIQNLKNLQTLTLYWPLTLGLHQGCIKYEKMIEQSLSTLPKLKFFKMICHDIKSSDSFKNLGNRFEAIKSPVWYNKQNWYN